MAKAVQKEVVIYISMGFGNPYGEVWNVEIVEEWVDKMAALGIKTISLSDTIGTSNPETIAYLFSDLIPKYPQITFGAHLHTTARAWREKIDAAYNAGCRRFDGAIKKGMAAAPWRKTSSAATWPQRISSVLRPIKN